MVQVSQTETENICKGEEEEEEKKSKSCRSVSASWASKSPPRADLKVSWFDFYPTNILRRSLFE